MWPRGLSNSPLQSRISQGLQLLAQFRVLCFQCRYSLLKCCDLGYRVYSLCGSVVRCEGRHTMFSHRFTGCTLGIPHALGSKLELIFAGARCCDLLFCGQSSHCCGCIDGDDT